MVAKKQTVSVSKSIINAIVSSGENGISVQELMDQYKCTKTTIYAAINFSRKMKKEHKQVGYPGSIVSIDGRYYHKMEIDQPDKAHMIKPPTIDFYDIINEINHELTTIPKEYTEQYLESREKSLIYECQTDILKTITRLFGEIRSSHGIK